MVWWQSLKSTRRMTSKAKQGGQRCTNECRTTLNPSVSLAAILWRVTRCPPERTIIKYSVLVRELSKNWKALCECSIRKKECCSVGGSPSFLVGALCDIPKNGCKGDYESIKAKKNTFDSCCAKNRSHSPIFLKIIVILISIEKELLVIKLTFPPQSRFLGLFYRCHPYDMELNPTSC